MMKRITKAIFLALALLAGEAVAICIPTTVAGVPSPFIAGVGNLELGNNGTVNGTPIVVSGTTSLPVTGTTSALSAGALPALSPATFPAVGTGTLNTTGTVAAGSYGTINASGNPTVFSGGTYYIDTLKATGPIQLAAGTYYINKLELSADLTETGAMQLFIGDKIELKKNNISLGSDDNAGNLQVNLYGDAEFDAEKNNISFTGLIYSPFANSEVKFKNNATITGAIITAGQMEFGNNTTVNYDATVQEQISSIACPVSGLDHLQIEHDGEGSNCVAESITVKACANAACSSVVTTGGITASLQPYGIAVSIGTSGSVLLSATPSTVGTNTLNATSISPTPTNATVTCLNTATTIASCSMVVSACPGGSNFNCLETTITPYSSGTARLYTKLAGSPFSFDVVALNSSGAVESNYVVSGGTAKNVTVELFDDSLPAASCSAYANPVASQTLSIGSTSAGRKTTANFSVANAYAKLLCRVSDANGASTIYGCSSDDFSVRPGAATLMTSASAAAPTATAQPVINVGAAFTIGATTTTSAGYTGTLTLDTAKLTAQLPSNGSTSQSGGAVGSLTVSPAVQANASPSQSNNATWSEVGYLYAAAGTFRDDDFTLVDQTVGDCISSTTDDAYLADTFDVNNKIGCSIGNKTPVSFGRFVPDHFTAIGTVTNACAAGTFTYMGQSFTLSSANVVEARNAANGVTQNYAGVYAPGTVSFGAENADNGTDLSSRLGFPSGSWILGAYSLTSASGTFSRPTATVSDATWGFFESLDIGLTVNDNDVTTLPKVSGADMNPSAAGGSSFAYKKFSGSPLRMRLGRLSLQNAYGSELLALPMALTAEYWNGNSWVANAVDGCTALTAPTNGSGLTLNLAGSGTTTATLSNPLVSGNAGLSLAAPGASHTGYVDVVINSPAWLDFNWKGAGDTDPTARATFGIYKGNSKFIYIRELY